MEETLARFVAVEGDLSVKRGVLLEGLVDLIEAEFWFWGVVGRHAPGKSPGSQSA